MAHHKRHRPKSQRNGCLMCKPHKHQGMRKEVRVKGLRAPRRLDDAARELAWEGQ